MGKGSEDICTNTNYIIYIYARARTHTHTYIHIGNVRVASAQVAIHKNLRLPADRPMDDEPRSCGSLTCGTFGTSVLAAARP